MRLALPLVLALAACHSHSGPSEADCKLVLADPPNALAALSTARNGEADPAELSTVIEQCIAPSGDDCARLAALAKAIPTMLPPGAFDCTKLSDAERRCMFPSYSIGHIEECNHTLGAMH
ncbi:MAG TPA: hypothetical protein VGM88_11935 [Kofleriaceae bacterium]|jgi:hypothetical protein